jgi:hypothetical protein
MNRNCKHLRWLYWIFKGDKLECVYDRDLRRIYPNDQPFSTFLHSFWCWPLLPHLSHSHSSFHFLFLWNTKIYVLPLYQKTKYMFYFYQTKIYVNWHKILFNILVLPQFKMNMIYTYCSWHFLSFSFTIYMENNMH